MKTGLVIVVLALAACGTDDAAHLDGGAPDATTKGIVVHASEIADTAGREVRVFIRYTDPDLQPPNGLPVEICVPGIEGLLSFTRTVSANPMMTVGCFDRAPAAFTDDSYQVLGRVFNIQDGLAVQCSETTVTVIDGFGEVSLPPFEAASQPGECP